MSDVDEPHLDVLTWLNELCLAEQSTLQLSWSGEEAARLLEGLADSAVTSVDFITKPRETKPLPALIDALTQPDTHLIKQDAVRLASKFGTVANMLLMAPDTPLPSFGPKKVSRVSEIFRAPFGASSAAHNSNAGGGSTNIVISSGTAPRGLEGAGGGGAAPPQQTSASSASPLPMHSVAFAAALERHRFHEATEEDV
jgi:hypothetical protein